jgi:hypothetical protein
MGSVKPGVVEQKPRGLWGVKHGRHRGCPRLEVLEGRHLLSILGNPYYNPTTINLADAEHGPMANLGVDMVTVYQAFENGNVDTATLANEYPSYMFQGNSILIGLNAYTHFSSLQTQASNLGMQVIATNPNVRLIEGWLPINELPMAAKLPELLSGHPVLRPTVNAGKAINEADFSMLSTQLKQSTGLTGAGVTVGILSTSFNNLGGYAADVASGDLPANVNIVQDVPPGTQATIGDDEGRGMAQNVFHIAPGAKLAFATALPNDAAMATNILALANQAGAKVIVDDIIYADDPFFQPGLISQSIQTVVNKGVTYLSSAGNAADGGYLSDFRMASGTVNSQLSGNFFNFNPNGGTQLTYPITVNNDGANISFQFDEPFATQQASTSNLVTSQLNFYLLNPTTGAIVASGTDDNTQTQEPFQFLTNIPAGNYDVAIQLVKVKGPIPGKVEFVQFGNASITIPKTFGSAGGTFYPTSIGHNAYSATIGVGAMPWWATYPTTIQTPIASEFFSSFGPQIQTRDANGNALSTPVQPENPVITAPDGSSTTFFGDPPPSDTTVLIPKTSTNLYASFTPSQVDNWAFFGTSSAAPNAAAVVALMLQKAPGATPANIRQALIDSGQAMNGTPQGQLNLQSGFGLINAVAALNAIVALAGFNPNNTKGIFVGASQFVTDSTQPEGDRANPYPTITAALAAAAAGDRLEILPGVYTETLTLTPLVSLESASVDSTDTTFVPGDALSTIIRAPATAASGSATIVASNLSPFVDPKTGAVFQSEIAGLSIASPLVGDPALGSINPNSMGIFATNSSLLIDKDYFVDSGSGVLSVTSGSNSQAPVIENDGFIGNLNGITLNDDGTSNSSTTTLILNNTVAYNTIGLLALNTTGTKSQQAFVANNIFWENHDQTSARGGLGIFSQTINKLVLNNNMFFGNGASDTNSSGAAVNIGNGFNPGLLGPTATSAASNQGNFVGYPAFVTPIDARPGSDGPGFFFSVANYSLTSSSAAINNALESEATKTDFLGNPENPEPTTMGFKIPGFGTRDVGAFEFVPIGSAITTAVGGSFRVVTTSLVPDGGSKANGRVDQVTSPPGSITVSFSQPVNSASVHATDLVLSGSAVSSLSPVRATSIIWLDNHTARFNLNGQLNPVGTLNLALNPDAIKSNTSATLASYSDTVVIDSANLPPSSTPAPAPTTPVTPPLGPAPTAPPKKTSKHTVSHPHKPVVTTVNHLKKMARHGLASRSRTIPEKGKKG